MRTIVGLLVAAIVAHPTGAVAQTTADKEAKIRRGRQLVWVGAGLAATGVFLLPLTAPGSDEAQKGMRIGTAVGLVTIGGVVAIIGGKQQRKAARPDTDFDISIGRRTAVTFRRTW